jgi:hypothetical protein
MLNHSSFSPPGTVVLSYKSPENVLDDLSVSNKLHVLLLLLLSFALMSRRLVSSSILKSTFFPAGRALLLIALSIDLQNKITNLNKSYIGGFSKQTKEKS